jgi:hypothetical protein
VSFYFLLLLGKLVSRGLCCQPKAILTICLSHIHSYSLEKHLSINAKCFWLRESNRLFLEKDLFQIRLKKLHNFQPVYKNDTCPFSYKKHVLFLIAMTSLKKLLKRHMRGKCYAN